MTKLPRIELVTGVYEGETRVTYFLTYLDEDGAGPDIMWDGRSHAEAMDEVAWWLEEEPEAHFVDRTDPLDRLPSSSRH